LDSQEECDDGNTRTGDGCDSSCHEENHDGCGGPVLELDKETVILTGTTIGATDDITRSGGVQKCAAGDRAGSDLIYAIKPSVGGTLTATLEAKYNNHFLHIRNACPGVDSNEIACDYAYTSSEMDVSTVTVTAGKVLYVTADGHEDGAGPFTLTLKLQ
jgi:cysteine-rich repeat protein